MSKSLQFIVLGRYSHEQSYHVVSSHHTASAAWRSAHRAHMMLGGCDGGDMLCSVHRRASKDETAAYHTVINSGDPYDYVNRVSRISAAECDVIDGIVYLPCDIFDGHNIVWAGGQIALVVK